MKSPSGNHEVILFIKAGIAVIGGFYLLHRALKELRRQSAAAKRNKMPEKWIQVGHLGKIGFYPLKSAKPVTLDKAEFTELGVKEICDDCDSQDNALIDRSFVMYDLQEKKVLKILKARHAILINTKHEHNSSLVTFTIPEYGNFTLDLDDVKKTAHKIQDINSYDTLMEALDCGDEIAAWLSRYLTGENEITHRLGYFCADLLARPDPITFSLNSGFRTVYDFWRSRDAGLYSWLSSYMLVGSSSVADVNDKIPESDRFTDLQIRPNIVIDGCQKYDEDKWNWIKIGNKVILRSIKLCTRCMHITIDPYTGDRNANMEPIKTLQKFRKMKQVAGIDKQGNKTVLGINVGLYIPGEVKVGDPVYVSYQ